MKPFDGTLRVFKPVRESLANSRKRYLVKRLEQLGYEVQLAAKHAA